MAVPTHPRLLPGFLVIAAIGASLLAPRPGAAQESGDQRMAFDIPAQPLDSALAQYFRVTGVQLLYDSALTTGRRSSPIHGNYAPREALRLLLRGTGLVARYSRTNAAILTTPETTGDAALIPLGRVVVREQAAPPRLTMIQRMEFYGRLENELQAYLRNDQRTDRLSFNALISVRVAAGGKLVDLKISRGSGDARIDRLVVEVLAGRSVSSPPDGIGQPLLVSLKGAHRSEE